MMAPALARTRPAGKITAAGSTPRRWDRLGPWLFWLALAAGGGWAVLAQPQYAVVGAIVGTLYALGALGLTLIYGIAKVPHFAHGDAMMLAAYLAFLLLSGTLAGATDDATLPLRLDRLPGAAEPVWRFSFGYGLVLAILLVVPLIALLCLGLDRLVYRPLLDRGAQTALLAIASLGVAIGLRGLMLLLWGPTPRKYTTGIRETIELPGWAGGGRLVADQLFILGAAALLTAAVAFVLYRTPAGRAMRATADNPDLARASGIPAGAVRRWTWLAGGTAIAVAGCLLALQSQLKPELGFVLILPIFAAAVLGGVGSPHGALLGGLIVGVAAEVVIGVGAIKPDYKLAVAFALLIGVILVRPRGLFGVNGGRL